MCSRNPMRVIGGGLSITYLSLGLTFFVIGFVLQVAPASSMLKYISAYTTQMNTLLAPARAQFDPMDYIYELPNITGNIAAAFIAMGAVQTIIGTIGLIALCRGKRRPILTAFFIILCVMIILQVALVVLFYSLRLRIITQAKQTYRDAINRKYNNYNNTNMETVLINVFHVSLGCCGIDSGMDFDSSTNWPRNVRFGGRDYNATARPLTCCKTGNYTACLLTNHTDMTYTNQGRGCWGDIESIAGSNVIYAALGTGALILLEVLLLAMSASVCYTGRMKPTELDLDQPIL